MAGQTAKRRLTNLVVHFISLVGKAANRRKFLVKSAATEGCTVVETEVRILKTDPTRRMVYGIVYAPDEVDAHGDTATAEVIEKAAYEFMRSRRTTAIDADHDGEAGKGFVAETWLIRSGDPVFPKEPEGAWAVGVKITDDEVWEKITNGSLTGLSLAGLAAVEEVEKDETGTDETEADAEDVEKGETGTKEATAPDVDAIVAEIEKVSALVEALTKRLERVEKATPGRTAIVGGDDAGESKEKGFKGVRIL